ncbi:MAG: protoporphyrinogen oxidase [Gemmatimonadota bacterium]|nr:protoporphyrinogen oxidase [Gemmatimonadota bacterium]
MPRLVVIGGGISGLAAAWAAADAAHRAGERLEVVVLERDREVGGKARSHREDGWLVEGGPSGFLRGKPEFERLIAAAGMTDAVVDARAAARRRFVYRAGALRLIRPSPVSLVRSGILGVGGAVRLAGEVVVPRARPHGHDETVWEFAVRRIGVQAADRLVAPMCLGVFAGDAKRLSLQSAFPRMAALERDHGGLIRGLIAKRGRMSTGSLASFRDGMQSLPLALAERGGFTVARDVEVMRLGHDGRRWAIATRRSGTVTADAVVLAVEPWVASGIVGSIAPAAATALGDIPCPSVAVVALGFGPAARARIPDGFGVLVSRGEGVRMLGNLWETSLYPGRGPDGGILVRAMLGGAVDPDIASLDDAAVLALAEDEVGRLYGLAEAPVFRRVVRIAKAIPQYECGHAGRVAAVEHAVGALPNLDVTGFGLRGVAFGDAASDGMRTGARMVARLRAAVAAAVA